MTRNTHDTKTNAMRVLDAAHIPYEHYHFPVTQVPTGIEVANILGRDTRCVFKTLVTQGKTGESFVFMIPVACELDLKKAAKAVGEKSIAMLPSKKLLDLTGYVHGGCSPIGMKKQFTTCIDNAAKTQETILFSGGRVGCQIECSPDDLARVVDFRYTDLTV